MSRDWNTYRKVKIHIHQCGVSIGYTDEEAAAIMNTARRGGTFDEDEELVLHDKRGDREVSRVLYRHIIGVSDVVVP